MRVQEEEGDDERRGESWEEEDREKLEESESVCECNSLPLSNPREFTDCRKEGERERERWRGIDRKRRNEEERERKGKGGGGGGCDHSREGDGEIQRERKQKQRETAGEER